MTDIERRRREEIVAKLRLVEVRVGRGTTTADAVGKLSCPNSAFDRSSL